MTHFLPGGGVPRVRGARSPVPARLPHFATPRSVRHLANVVAGAYPLRRPPDAWSPGLPAPPGPCYWLVTIGTPMGWRGGCLAVGLVRSTVCYYCLGGCRTLVVCARRSRLAWGVGAGSCVSPWAPPCPRVPREACRGLSRPGVSSLCLPVPHSTRSVRSAGSVQFPFGSAPRVRCVCARSCCRGVRASHLLRVGMVRALRAVLVQGAGMAASGNSCRGRVLRLFRSWGGGPASSSPCLARGRAPPPPRAGLLLCAGFARCGGGTRAPGGGASRLGVGCLGSGALPRPTVRPLRRAAGARYPLAVGVGAVGVGTRHELHSARSCELPCALWGRHEGARGALAWVWGVRGRALSQPRPPVLWGVRPGPTTDWLWVRGVWAWGPVTNPTGRALASWLCALWGRH